MLSHCFIMLCIIFLILVLSILWALRLRNNIVAQSLNLPRGIGDEFGEGERIETLYKTGLKRMCGRKGTVVRVKKGNRGRLSSVAA